MIYNKIQDKFIFTFLWFYIKGIITIISSAYKHFIDLWKPIWYIRYTIARGDSMYDKLNITSPKKGIIFCRTVVFL